MDRKEPQIEVPWIPSTPLKPIPLKPAPIYEPGERNQMGHHANGAVACAEFSLDQGRISEFGDRPNVDDDGGKTSDTVSSYSKLGFCEQLIAVEAESRNSSVTQGNNDGLKNQFIPSFIFRNVQDPQETYIACCSEKPSQDTPFTLDNANKEESSQVASMQINMEEKDPGGEERNILDNNVLANSKELCDPAMEFAAVSSPLKENHNPDKGLSHESVLNKTPQQKPRRRKHRPKVIREDKPKRTRKPVTPKPVQSQANPPVKRKYVRKKGLNKTSNPPPEVTSELTEEMPGYAKMSCKRTLNFDLGIRDETSAGMENTTALLGKENGILIQETNVSPAFDLHTSMKQVSNSYMSLPEEDPQSSLTKRIKRKYERKKGVNKTSAPPTEVTGELTKEKMPESTQMSCTGSLKFDERATDQSYAVKENPTIHPGSEIGVIMQEMNVNLACDLNTSMKQTSDSYMPLKEDTQIPHIPSFRKSCGTEPNANPAAKRKNIRKKRVNKTSATEVTQEMTSAKMSCTGSVNYFDEGARDKSYVVQQNPIVQSGSDIGVVMQDINIGFAYDLDTAMRQALSVRKNSSARPEENPTAKRKYGKRKGMNTTHPSEEVSGAMTKEMMPASTQKAYPGSENLIGVVMQGMNAGLAYDLSASMKQTLKGDLTIPKDTQAPNSSLKMNVPGTQTKGSLTGKKNMRKNGLNQSPVLPIEMTELTEARMLESNNMSWRRSLNFDLGTREARYVGRENLDLQIGKENMVLEETEVGLTYNQATWMKEALNNCMSLSKETQHASASISKCTPLGAKLNANSGENKNKKGQATAQDGNIINGQSSTIRLQTVGSKRRKYSGTFKTADDSSINMIGAHYNALSSYQTSFYLQFPNIQKKRRSEKGKTSNTYITSVTATEEVHQTYPSSSSCWMYGSGYDTAGVPTISELAENYIDNTQTFDEFVLSLKRLAERSQISNCDRGSLTRIGNCDTEPNCSAKQVGVSDRETFGDAKTTETCIGPLVAETHTSLTKKKRHRKKFLLSSSAHSSTNEMLQHFTLGNYPLSRGKSSAAVLRKNKKSIEALILQFRRLNINTEARDLAFPEQNALVPYQKQNSLIHGDEMIVPFNIKKQHLRPKVDLDDETDRVWRLLLLDINSHGIDGTDEDKAKWWEEERNVFRGRADSFIARMHLVQGDRRFSRWKGSVVDSVVGVFLTQNVSDHLSSSAFMSLAARFSKNSSSTRETHNAEDSRLVVNEPQVHIVEPEENTEWDVKLLNQSVYDQSSLTIDIVERPGEKEAINSNDSCGTASSIISLIDESNSILSELSRRHTKEHSSPMRSRLLSATIEEAEEKSCYDGERKDLNDIVSSQGSVISSQVSGDQHHEKIGSCSDSNSEVEVLSSAAKYNRFDGNTSFSKLLEIVSLNKFETHQSSEASTILSPEYSLKLTPNSGLLEVNCFDPFKTEASTSDSLKKTEENHMNSFDFQTEPAGQVAITYSQSIVSEVHPQEESNQQQQNFFKVSGQSQDLMQKEKGSGLGEHKNAVRNGTNEMSSASIKLKSKAQGKEKQDDFNWDSLRIEAQAKAGKREKTENTMDSLDWDAVRCADVNVIAETIKERGMNNRLAERIKNFLNRLVEEHGSIDLEWLRDVPPDKAKEYLLSIRGLGLKSVECVRLLTLHHLAFPVDTNVGRIAVRLGWVPLQPLPESLQLHLLELYPVLESIQKYLWPRLCKLDQKTLYELHYQMITFGKVFCTKSKPNCNACPMRGECRHFASAFASARLALPGPEQKSIVSMAENIVIDQHPSEIISQLHLPPPENTTQAEEIQLKEVSRHLETKSEINTCQPIIEEPTSPEPECSQVSQTDIEDAFDEDSCEIPTIKLNIEEFTLNLQNYMQEKMELQEGEMSKALVALNPQVASIPMPKLKNVSRLRTEHCVYELPDTHPLLQGWDTREPDDPGKYLLAIWTPGETADSIQPPESKCSYQEGYDQLWVRGGNTSA
ncbi:hypothetical protein VNO78_21000 [Psophocarpus tetragonolobus]|uniref:HhH-GPD domain-containing protein n=1 Tax=Psophocarpus tetragonolobus TaxID=3891 RepID=A0AAN9XH95_PSOTE